MTLDEMINIILDQTGNDTSSRSEYFTRFKTAINYAKNKIAREKFAPDYTETVNLTSETFDTTSLSKTFLKIKTITDTNSYDLDWDFVSSHKIKVPGQTSATVLYQYIPADLINSLDVLDFPAIVDPQILCFYASYEYFLAEGGTDDLSKSSYWLSLWNDGFANIFKGEKKKIKDVYRQ